MTDGQRPLEPYAVLARRELEERMPDFTCVERVLSASSKTPCFSVQLEYPESPNSLTRIAALYRRAGDSRLRSYSVMMSPETLRESVARVSAIAAYAAAIREDATGRRGYEP